jgi:hypothetical protein
MYTAMKYNFLIFADLQDVSYQASFDGFSHISQNISAISAHPSASPISFIHHPPASSLPRLTNQPLSPVSPTSLTHEPHPPASSDSLIQQPHPPASPTNLPISLTHSSTHSFTYQSHPPISSTNLTYQSHPLVSPTKLTHRCQPPTSPTSSPMDLTHQSHPQVSPTSLTHKSHPPASPASLIHPSHLALLRDLPLDHMAGHVGLEQVVRPEDIRLVVSVRAQPVVQLHPEYPRTHKSYRI